jgi:hypothetical protein
MAVVATTSKSVAGAANYPATLLATSGDTLVYTAGTSQELWLFNTDVSPIVVTVDGSGGTTVVLPNAGGATASVAAGLAITVAAGTYQMVNLDKVSAYCQGTVAISAATGAKVAACITV